MNENKPTTLIAHLASLLPPDWLQARARHHKVLVRRRKVDTFAFVWTLVLGFAASNKRSITALRESFEKNAGISISRTGFYNRFDAQLVALLKDCFQHLLGQAAAIQSPIQSQALLRFTNILAIDSTLVALWELLAKKLPSTHADKAAAKVHLVYNVVHGRPSSVRITDGKSSDQGPWKRVGKWVGGSLLLFDLGYYNFCLFHRIDRNNGLFLSRAKTNFNPVIIGINGKVRGRSRDLVGRKLQDVLPGLKRRVLDLQVRVGFLKGRYGGRRRRGTAVFRLVGLWDVDAKRYRLYLTNLSVTDADADTVGELYRLRWQVEIAIKALKSHHRLHQVPTSNENVAKALLWASLVSLMVSRVLLKVIRQHLDILRHIPHLRFSAVFERISGDLLRELLKGYRQSARCADPWLRFILRHAPDPNLDRWIPLYALSRA